jgi:dipeptidase E
MEDQVNNIVSILKQALWFEIGLVVLLLLSYFVIVDIKKRREEEKAKTLLLTSSGLDMRTEILKLLQKPPYNTSVAVITTAAKPEENQEYLRKDLAIMRDIGFNIEEIDIEGKKEADLFKMLELKDLIFVEGGNTFYLLKAMRACNFKKVIMKLLKKGIVYIGVSAGSIVAGRTIQTADNFGTGNRNRFGIKNIKGLGLVHFDILPHYDSTKDETIKQKIKSPRKRKRFLKILSDGQALLVQGKDLYYLGKGEQIIV